MNIGHRTEMNEWMFYKASQFSTNVPYRRDFRFSWQTFLDFLVVLHSAIARSSPWKRHESPLCLRISRSMLPGVVVTMHIRRYSTHSRNFILNSWPKRYLRQTRKSLKRYERLTVVKGSRMCGENVSFLSVLLWKCRQANLVYGNLTIDITVFINDQLYVSSPVRVRQGAAAPIDTYTTT